MANLISEYINKRMSPPQLIEELKQLIKKYNSQTGRWLLVYASDPSKGNLSSGVDPSLNMQDFYMIQDILHDCVNQNIDIYLETPGGSGEAAEEIAKFLHNKFTEVGFIIAGEAKSAGTILVLSGDKISMTDTGSLGPIDAQIMVGRSRVSAYDYLEWVKEVRDETEKTNSIIPFNAVMVAQISPGELKGVENSLKFATSLVEEWLERYKFKNWSITESRKLRVTDEMKKNRAKEVAQYLVNHTEWKSHARSLKIKDFDGLLKIDRIDDKTKISDIVYRIKTVIGLLFDSSPYFKAFILENLDIFRTVATMTQGAPGMIPEIKDKNARVEFGILCPRCKTENKAFGYINATFKSIKDAALPRDPKVINNMIICRSCGFNIDLTPAKTVIEAQTKKTIII
jgi:hypothetical protein